MCLLAVMTGLIIARFSRPRARFVFANNAVITRHERTTEGEQLRRFYELKLDRGDHPIFVLSWNLFHFIDKDSPLHGPTASDLTQGDAFLVLNVGGVDDSSIQQLHARRIYSWRDIRWQHRYEDITSVSSQGRMLLDH